MNHIRLNLAADINRHHELACQRADEAINHAMEAGKLLLEAKAALAHGEWLPWLTANITVTPRQVQRYMRVAQGKPLPIRVISSNTTPVSHLEKDWTPRPEFLPLAGHSYRCADAYGAWAVEPSAQHTGFFFISRMYPDCETYDCTRRPVRADWVETFLERGFGLKRAAAAQWHAQPCEGVDAALDSMSAVGLSAALRLTGSGVHEAIRVQQQRPLLLR